MSEMENNQVNGEVNGQVNGQVNEEVNGQKEKYNNKRLLLWGILIVVVAIVLYVLFGSNKEKVRLNTEVRNLLPSVSAATTQTFPTPASSLSVNEESESAVRKELANLFRSYA